MIDKTLVFFQSLLNDPSVTSSQRNTILKLRRNYLSSGSKEESEKPVANDGDTFTQPANVARLLSKFDMGKEYGIILHPDDSDETAFAKSIATIQKRLIQDVLSTSIPKTLKALLFLFVLGKYSTYTKWIGGDGKKYSLTCSSTIVKGLCQNAHPLHVKAIAPEFIQFEKAITVNGDSLDKILDMFEAVFCKSTISDEELDANYEEEVNSYEEVTLDSEISLIESQPKRIILDRINLENVYFHTNASIFRTALLWLLIIIASNTPKDGRISVAYKEMNNLCKIIVCHNCKSDDTDHIEEMADVMEKMNSTIKGYAEVSVKSDDYGMTYCLSFHK